MCLFLVISYYIHVSIYVLDGDKMSDIIGVSIVTAFWAATAFFGGFTFTAWKKWVCLILCVISGIFMAVYASGIIAEGMMVEGINTLWTILNGFTGADVVATFFALIAGLWFGEAYGHK